MDEYTGFRKYITPRIINGVFWALSVLVVIFGLSFIIQGTRIPFGGGTPLILMGILYIILGPLLIRIYCEVIAIMFQIYGALIDIRNKVTEARPPSSEEPPPASE